MYELTLKMGERNGQDYKIIKFKFHLSVVEEVGRTILVITSMMHSRVEMMHVDSAYIKILNRCQRYLD